MTRASKAAKPLVRCALAALLSGAAALAVGAACVDPDAGFVYTARAYDAAGLCVGPYVELEWVQGGGGGIDCPPAPSPGSSAGIACLVSPSGAVYASQVCAPYPPDYDTSGTNPACPAAIAALAKEKECGAGDAGGDAPPLHEGAMD